MVGDLVPRTNPHIHQDQSESTDAKISLEDTDQRQSEETNDLSAEDYFSSRTLAEKDRPPRLALPSTPPLSPTDNKIFRLLQPVSRLWDARGLNPGVKQALVRGVKSTLLVAKVCSY